MKTGPDALGNAENVSRRAKHENETRYLRCCRKRVSERKTRKKDPMHSAPPKTCPGAQNMNTGPDALGTAKNESGRTN
jgi:hypothetical protein